MLKLYERTRKYELFPLLSLVIIKGIYSVWKFIRSKLFSVFDTIFVTAF